MLTLVASCVDQVRVARAASVNALRADAQGCLRLRGRRSGGRSRRNLLLFAAADDDDGRQGQNHKNPIHFVVIQIILQSERARIWPA